LGCHRRIVSPSLSISRSDGIVNVMAALFLWPCFFSFGICSFFKVAALWLGRRFYDRFHCRQSLLELTADHLIHD